MTVAATVHASAVSSGDVGILIRGPSAAGKSQLAFDLILAGRAGVISPTLLVGDDRLLLSVERDRLMMRPAPELAGLIEIRGLGIRRCDFAAVASVGLVVDLYAADAARLPDPSVLWAQIEGIKIPRIPVERGAPALTVALAGLLTRPLPDV